MTEEIKILKELVDAYERMEVNLKKVKRHLFNIHNNDDPAITTDNLRAECLVLASNIGLEFDAANFWNIKPVIIKAKEILAQ